MPRPDQQAPANTAMPQPSASGSGFLSSSARSTLVAAAVLVALGAAGIPWFLSSPEWISRLVARAVPGLRADVRFDRVRLTWFGPMILEGLRVVPRDGGHEPITAARVEVAHGIAGILLSMGDLGRVRVEGLEARVVFDADRDSNLKSLFEPPADDAPDHGQGAPRPPVRSPVRMRLDLADALVRIEGPWTAEPWVSDPINVRATLGPSTEGGWSQWKIEPVQLLADARLEPAVAQGVLAYIAPLLADATRTGGRFSLRLDEATLPVGSPETGHLSGVLSMHAVDLGPGPMVTRAIEALPGRLPAPPVIRIADQSHIEFRLLDRHVWHKGLAFGVPLAKPGQRLDVQSSGSVSLVDKSLDLKLELPIPGDLPQDRPVLASLAGRTLTMRIGGELGAPRVNLDGTLRSTAGAVVAEVVERLSGRAAGGPRQPQVSPLEPQRRPDRPPTPGWRPDAAGPAAAGGAKTPAAAGANPPAPSADRPVTTPDGTADARTGGGSAADRTRSPAAPDMKTDATADAVIDLVGGVIGELARRRAERQAAEASAPPQSQQPPRRGRLFRRFAAPGGAQPAPAEPAPLQPVPRQSEGRAE